MSAPNPYQAPSSDHAPPPPAPAPIKHGPSDLEWRERFMMVVVAAALGAAAYILTQLTGVHFAGRSLDVMTTTALALIVACGVPAYAWARWHRIARERRWVWILISLLGAAIVWLAVIVPWVLER